MLYDEEFCALGTLSRNATTVEPRRVQTRQRDREYTYINHI
jgi:hypothetical protein